MWNSTTVALIIWVGGRLALSPAGLKQNQILVSWSNKAIEAPPQYLSVGTIVSCFFVVLFLSLYGRYSALRL